MFYNSDSSDEPLTTYSEDQRYSRYKLDIRKQEQEEKESRKREFEKLANEQDNPSLLYKNISKKIIFYCSLRYLEKYKKWRISREPMPAIPLFYKVTSGLVLIDDNLSDIAEVVINIYTRLRRWAEREVIYRRKKNEKYRAGKLCYLDIDSTDEELYFSEDERKELFETRQAVLKRMIPPSTFKLRAPPKGRPTKIKYKI